MLTRYCILDLETVPVDDCRQWLGEIEAPGNYSKPDSIAKYIEEETAKRIEKAGLDPELCKVVALGLWASRSAEPSVTLIQTPEQERIALNAIWAHVSSTCPMLGYGVSFFDAGVLVRRSQLLGVKVPDKFFQYGRWHHEWIVDLADRLTLNGRIVQKAGRGLEYHCRRMGVDVMDDITGKDIAALWKEGAHDAVRAHCLADLTRIRSLAERLHMIEPIREGMTYGDVAAF